jgi:uncharacterized membrane protein
MQLLMIGVPSREEGLMALDRLADAVMDGEVSVEDAALVYKDEKGRVKIHQTHDASAGMGAARGGALGVLVGLFAAPLVAAAAVGAGAGAVVSRVRDSGVSDKLMKEAGTLIEGNEAGIFVLADDASAIAIAARIEALMAGGQEVSYQMVSPETQDFLRETIKLAR